MSSRFSIIYRPVNILATIYLLDIGSFETYSPCVAGKMQTAEVSLRILYRVFGVEMIKIDIRVYQVSPFT